jgi:hypothetical protein
MIDLQTVLTYLTLISIPVGVFYHIMTLRNQQKARKSMMLVNFQRERSSVEDQLTYAYIQNMEWIDYDDYQNKYGRKTNPEAWAKIQAYLNKLEDTGLMARRGLVDIDDMYDLSLRSIPSLWKKFKPIIMEIRRRSHPQYLKELEYLVDELHKLSRKRGDGLLKDLE